MSPLEAGQQAPIVDLPLQDAEGNPRELDAAIAAGPVLLTIYKSSCQASKTIFPMLERLHQRYGQRGLTVLGVAQDSANITRSFARRSGSSFPILIEPDGYPISTVYDIFATPTVFLIRPDRAIAFTTMGFFRETINQLGDAVAAELGDPPTPLITDQDVDIPMFVPG